MHLDALAIGSWDSTVVALDYLAEVRVEAFPSVIARVIVAGDECLIGRRLLDNYKATFDHGREITLES